MTEVLFICFGDDFMTLVEYDRKKAVAYAKRWALGRNSEFYDYSGIGGNCTNFASQCVYAGCGVMNYTKDFGWYYIDANDKSPSWTGVEYLKNFITTNDSVGPFGEITRLSRLLPGDIIQLVGADGRAFHTVVLTDIRKTRLGVRYLVCAHSRDVYQKNLFSYSFSSLICIHIIAARK